MLIISQQLIDMLYFKVLQTTGDTKVILVSILSSYIVHVGVKGTNLQRVEVVFNRQKKNLLMAEINCDFYAISTPP